MKTTSKIKLSVANELKKEVDALSGSSIEEICSYVFRSNETLRLSTIGASYMRKVFSYHVFEIDRRKLKTKHLIALSSSMEYPYYITNFECIVFSSGDALMITLCGGLDKFIESRGYT